MENINTPYIINEDGTISLCVDRENANVFNMLTEILVTNDEALGINANLDMKIVKDETDNSKFNVTYGNFGIDESSLDQSFIDLLNKKLALYDKNTNYKEYLELTSPSLSLIFDMVYDHVLEKDGSFRMAVKNNSKTLDVVLGFGEEYDTLVDVFSNSGCVAVNNTIRMENINYPNQRKILEDASSNLKELSKGGYQYVKKLDTAANSSNFFLMAVTSANIALLVIYLAMKLIK